MSPQTAEKIQNLRSHFPQLNLNGYLIPAADAHLNEYTAPDQKRRDWLTGFTGSAGDCLVTENEAWVFADSRYHEQAEKEVDQTQIHIAKVGLEKEPTLLEVLDQLAQKSFRLGLDPNTLTVEQYHQFQQRFSQTHLELVPVKANLIDILWTTDRPPAKLDPVYFLEEPFSGEHMASKLTRVRAQMAIHQIDVLPLIKLDQIAWLFNLRGSDIPQNPVFTAYAIITPDKAYLFTSLPRVPQAVQAYLKNTVTLRSYETYHETLRTILTEGAGSHHQHIRLSLDPKYTPYGTYWLAQQAGALLDERPSPVQRFKAVKNPVELAQMQQANLQASRAKVRTWFWIEQQIKAGKTLSEKNIQAQIEHYYSEEPHFQDLSFTTIAGIGANSSIVHYGTPSEQATLSPSKFLLLDSGAQYLGGTTDDTRTFLFGKASSLQKKRYTEVLKAHINCAMQRFPKGTDGIKLDGITRATLWQSNLDYGHGTGHGVGAFLNVHEGPNGIHGRASEPLLPGMVTSIEPGFYESGWGGIRLENLYHVKALNEANGISWYGFESLTWIPFDKRLIELSRLSRQQQSWLKRYHQGVYKRLAPTLPAQEARWLAQKCR